MQARPHLSTCVYILRSNRAEIQAWLYGEGEKLPGLRSVAEADLADCNMRGKLLQNDLRMLKSFVGTETRRNGRW